MSIDDISIMFATRTAQIDDANKLQIAAFGTGKKKRKAKSRGVYKEMKI